MASSSSTKPKNSRPLQKTSSSAENEPPQKIAKHSSYDNIGDDYVSSFTIDSIPDDILADILKMLPISSWPKLQRINRQFNRSILLCWRGNREIEFNKASFNVQKMYETENRMALKSILKMLSSYSPRIKSFIGFSYFVNYLPKSTLMEISVFKYLKSVNFSNCETRPEFLAVFLKKVANHLTELNISRCFCNQYCCPAVLTSEDIEMRQNNDSKLFDALKLLKLTKFYFDGNSALYGLFFDHLDASSITTISVVESVLNAEIFSSFLTRCRALSYLDISSPRFTCKNGENEISCQRSLPLSILSSLSSSTHIINNLTTLKMNSAIPISISQIERQERDRVFTDLFTKLINLRELSLIDNPRSIHNIITESAINSDRFRNLRHLHLTNAAGQVSLSIIEKLIRSMKNLERLLFYGICCDSADQVVHALISSPDLTESLRYLKLGHLNVQDSNILKELSMLNNLTGLSMNGTSVTNDVLLFWGAAFGGRLKILELAACPEISDAGFAISVEHWPNLIRLNLHRTNISDVSLRALSISCPKLKRLNLALCKNISTAGVQMVIDSCRRLELLELENSAVTYASLNVDQEISNKWDVND